MEIKVLCNCGQKYAFDAEPNEGKLTTVVNCPVCGVEGNDLANTYIAETMARTVSETPVTPPPLAGGLKLHRSEPQPAPVLAETQASDIPLAPPPFATGKPKPSAARPKVESYDARKLHNSMPLGFIGAMIGAVVGTALMVTFIAFLHFRLPYFGLITGALTGWLAKVMYKGTNYSLGVMAACVAGVFVAGTLYIFFGPFAIFGIMSLIVSVGAAWRIASG